MEELKQILDEDQIRTNEPLGRHTTFCIGGPADWYLMPKEEQLAALYAFLLQKRIPVTVIGNGSNLLIADNGIRGAVLEIGSRMSEISVQGERVMAQAGALLSKAAYMAYQHGLSGMEFAAGIPGSVGGAMVMNAGAYGGEMKDITESVRVLKKDGTQHTLSNAQMEFSYRDSMISKSGDLVLSASFVLKKADREQIFEKMEEYRKQRQEKQPLSFPSAGSTFKRPAGHFAGKLIMDAGLSGYASGGAMVSQKHCGFVINRGNATAADVVSVIRHVQDIVKERFGIDLETEVKLLGEF